MSAPEPTTSAPTPAAEKRPPRLTSDATRSWIAVGVSFVLGPTLVAVAVLGLWPRSTPLPQVVTIGVVLTLYYLVYLGLTWWVFIRRDPVTLRELVRASNARRRTSLERMSGADPTSFVLTAVGFALVTVAWTLMDPTTQRSPLALLLALAMVSLAWVVMQVSATLLLMRFDVDKPTLAFPDEGLHGWHDYSYVATQVLTTFATSDVAVRTTAGRRAITTLSVASMVFNTVVVALLVSGFLTVVGG